MSKVNTMITLDIDLKEQAQIKNINISEVCENALKDFLSGKSSSLEIEILRDKKLIEHLENELRTSTFNLKEKTDRLEFLLNREQQQKIQQEKEEKEELVMENKSRIEQKFKELDSVLFGEKQQWLDTDKPLKWDTPSDNLTIWENARARFNEAKVKVGYYDMVLYHDYKRLNKNEGIETVQ